MIIERMTKCIIIKGNADNIDFPLFKINDSLESKL